MLAQRGTRGATQHTREDRLPVTARCSRVQPKFRGATFYRHMMRTGLVSSGSWSCKASHAKPHRFHLRQDLVLSLGDQLVVTHTQSNTGRKGTARGDVTRSNAVAILAQVFGERADETTPWSSLFHLHRSASGTGWWRSTSAIDREGPCSFRVSGPTMFQRRCRRADDKVTISRLQAMREFAVEVEEYFVGHHTAGVRVHDADDGDPGRDCLPHMSSRPSEPDGLFRTAWHGSTKAVVHGTQDVQLTRRRRFQADDVQAGHGGVLVVSKRQLYRWCLLSS